MSRTFPLAVTAAFVLIVSACSGGGTPTTAPSAASSEAAPSQVAPSDSAAASESAAAACAPSTETGTVTATMKGFAFNPAAITAKVGDVVTWTNEDSAPHTATVKSEAACTTENLNNGASGGIVFNTAGSFDFFCKIHPQMTGKVEVS